jgi:hypothetical protein
MLATYANACHAGYLPTKRCVVVTSLSNHPAVKEADTMTPLLLNVDSVSMGSCRPHGSPRSLMT